MSHLPSLDVGSGSNAECERALKGTILIVEDDPTIVGLLSVLLKRQGWNIICAEDGKQALDAFCETPKIDMAIVDGRLPDMDGEAVCLKMRTSDPQLPLVLCSGMLSMGNVERVGGPAHFLPKPFSPSQIMAVINLMLPGSSAAI